MTAATTSADAAAAERPRGLPVWANPRLGIAAVLAGLIVLFGALRPAFYNTRLTVEPLLSDIAVVIVVGLAQMTVLGLGHMNLAVGRTAAISMFCTGLLCERTGAPLAVGAVVGIAAGALVGAFAGWVIARSGVNSFVVTLGLDFALVGIVALLYDRFTESATAFAGRPTGIVFMRGTASDVCIGPLCGPSVIPLVLPVALLAALACSWLFRRNRLGREILMVGSSERTAAFSGVPVGRRIIAAHAMSGAFAALGGLLLSINNGSITASTGSEFLLPSFLAAVLGGTALAGGVVSVLGTTLGAALMQVIYKGLNLLQFELDVLKVATGAVLLAALTLDRVRAVAAQRRGVART
jgi:ribose transport system permease protein